MAALLLPSGGARCDTVNWRLHCLVMVCPFREVNMLKSRLLLVFLLFWACAASAQIAKELVGRYQMDVQGGDVLELRADGSATLAGEATRWSATGNRLTVGGDTMPYSLQGNRLMMQMGPAQIAWKRLDGAASAGGNAQATQGRASPSPAANNNPNATPATMVVAARRMHRFARS